MKLSQDIEELVKKGGAAFLIRIVGFLAGYLFIFYTVKLFGAETQGRLSLSFSVMILVSLLCRLGIDINFVKIFSINGNFENAKGLYFKIAPLFIFISGISSIIVFLLSEQISEIIFKDSGLDIYLKWTAPCIFFFTFILINAAVFRGLRLNSLYSFLFNGGRFLFSIIVFFILIALFENKAYFTIIAHTTAIFLLFIISFFYINKYISPINTTTNYKVPAFVKNSIPMLLSASMIVFLGWADTIILGIFKSTDKVGIYNVALKIAAVTSFTFQALDSILAPKLSKTFHDNEMDQFKKLVKFSTLVNFIVSLFVVIGIVIFKDFILGIFGEEFYQASFALIILCAGQLFNAICGPVGSILQMTGHQKAFQNVLLIALIINIILNLVLVKSYGITGVAIATAVSLAFWNITSVIYIKQKKIY